jgi:predicted O-methyltransferase YrrM
MSVDLTRALQIPVTSSMFIHDLQCVAELSVDCQRIVELGCYHGRSTRAMLDSSQARIWCIDCWNLPPDRSGRDVSDADLQIFLDNIQDVRDRVVILRMFTREAAGLLPEGCFDLVVVDADHCYEAVKFDILHYGPLLRSGGILCGHDYRPGDGLVSKAVDELLTRPEILHKGVIWWAQKEEGWLREVEKENLDDVYYVVR